LNSERVEKYLDAGYGACHLAKEEIAELVATALRYFDGDRYRLHAWCVMPNHVHVVVQPFSAWTLERVLQNWKSFTAKVANRALARTSVFWQQESYDHLIRDTLDYTRAIAYVLMNPEAAKLRNWRWLGGPASDWS
jgi:REP element-mobilizing transposase RayT